jgi:MFS family permease
MSGTSFELAMENDSISRSSSYTAFRWYVMAAMLVSLIASNAIMIAPASLVEFIAHSLGVKVGPTTAATMGTWNFVAPFGAIIAGFFVNRLGASRTLLIGCGLLAIPGFLYPVVASRMGGIILLRAIQPLGFGAIYVCCTFVIATWFPPHQRSLVAGIQGACSSIGVALGFGIAPVAYAATHNNWLAMMACLAIGPAIGFLLVLVIPFGPKPPQVTAIMGDEEQVKADWKQTTREPGFYTGIVALFLFLWCYVAFNDLTPGYFAVSSPTGVGYGPVVAGNLMTTVQLCFMVGAAALGPIYEKVFKEDARSSMFVAFLGFALAALSVRHPLVYTNMRILYPVLAVAGFFLGWICPITVSFVSLNYPAHLAAKVNGLWFGLGLFGGIPAIGIGSTLLAKTGNYHGSLYVIVTVAVLGAVSALWMKPPKAFHC